MLRHPIRLLIIGAFLAIGLVMTASQIRPNKMGSGEYWLALSPSERTTYVAGFIDGYLSGTHQLCEKADGLFRVRDPHRVDPNVAPGFEASVLCMANRNDYSREYSNAGFDFSRYVDVISDFYTKHSDYRAVPISELMLSLADGKCENADQLYQRALRGEMLRVPSR